MINLFRSQRSSEYPGILMKVTGYSLKFRREIHERVTEMGGTDYLLVAISSVLSTGISEALRLPFITHTLRHDTGTVSPGVTRRDATGILYIVYPFYIDIKGRSPLPDDRASR